MMASLKMSIYFLLQSNAGIVHTIDVNLMQNFSMMVFIKIVEIEQTGTKNLGCIQRKVKQLKLSI